MSDRMIRYLIASVIFLVSFLVYFSTMPPTLSFWDSGEFIATSYILGIPHSPGTPLYVLVGRVFTMLPLQLTAAEKVNLLSVVFGSLGILMAYLIMVAVVRFMYDPPKNGIGRFITYAAPCVGAFFLMFSDTYWIDSTEAEVYSLSAFVMGLCSLLALKWYRNPSGELDTRIREEIKARSGKGEADSTIKELEKEKRGHSRNLVFLIVYLLSLGIGFHLGTILVFGGIFLLFLMVKNKSFSNFEFIVFTFGFAVFVADMTIHRHSQLTLLGLAVFAILIVWSTVSEGKFAIVATGLFILGISVHLFLLIRSGLDPAIDEVDPETWKALYAHLRREQYPPMNVFNRKASLLFQMGHFAGYFREQFRMLGDVVIGTFNLGKATVALPVALGLYGIAANFQRERKTWVLNFTVLLLNSAGLILFLNFSDHEVRERSYFYGGAFYYFAIFIGIGAAALLMALKEQADKTGRKALLRVLPVAIILIICSIIPVKYQWFRHDMSNNYTPRDYAYNLLAGLEPDAIIFTNGDNDTFPLWYIQTVENFRTDVRVANLSLLNTSWYIKQLRDEDPKMPIAWSDVEVEKLRPLALKGGRIAWRRDLVVQHAIRECEWSRPIYFSVTVPPEVWEPYSANLEMQGMVRRLVPRKGEHMANTFMLARNLDDIYEFRGVLKSSWERDDSFFKNEDTRGMYINFSLAAFRLGQEMAKEKNYGAAIERTRTSMALDPNFEWPKKYLGMYYLRNGEPQKAAVHYKLMIEEEPGVSEYWLGLANAYEKLGRYSDGLLALEEASRRIPGNRDIYIYGVRMAGFLKRKDAAVDFLERWLAEHPNDKDFRTIYEDIDSFFINEFGNIKVEPEIDDGSEE